MTFAQRLKSSAFGLGRTAAGVVLGLGLAVALVAQPSDAFAQAAPAAAPAAAPVVVPQAEGQGPALWVVRDADSTIYLFGTVHVLRPTTGWGTDKVDAAFDSASEVWFEISNPDDAAAIMPIVQQHGIDPTRPLSSLLTADELAKLDVAARTIGLSAAQLDPMRPWLATLTLATAPLVKAGYSGNSGVEMILKSRATAAGKTIHGFETADEQIQILANMPEDAQVKFLRAGLEDFDEGVAMLDGLVNSWSTGDVEGIERVIVKEMKVDTPEAYEALLVRRNANWARQIQTMLAGSGTVFVAVGGGHLAGEDSVQEQLGDLGIVATRQ